MLRTLFSVTILAGALAGSAMAQAPSYGHHGAGRVGHCAAAQAISTAKEARLRAASRRVGRARDQ